MESTCTRCDRRAAASVDTCMYCGGDVAHGPESGGAGFPPRVAHPTSKAVPAVDPGRVSAASRPAVPPVCASPESRAIRLDGGSPRSATVVAPPVAPARSATLVAPAVGSAPAAVSALPFPDVDSASLPMPSTRARALARRPVDLPVELDVPPLWLQIVSIPFATRGRAIFTCVAVFVIVSILGLNAVIDTNKPPETGGGFILDTSTGHPIALPAEAPYPMRSHVVTPSEVRSRKRSAAYESLREVGEVMKAHAEFHTAYPTELGGDLREIASFGDVAGPLSSFEGGVITRYEREMSSDFRTDRATLYAVPVGLDEVISVDFRFRRPKSVWPQ